MADLSPNSADVVECVLCDCTTPAATAQYEFGDLFPYCPACWAECRALERDPGDEQPKKGAQS